MEIIYTIADLKKHVREVRSSGKTIGLVPTMGALHAGHMSLVEKARSENDMVVVSVFVNPTQFGPAEDYSRYPRNLEADVDKCREAGVDIVFAPAVEEMYPAGFNTHVDVDTITNILEGASRPGHFRGVATVVLKLFNIAEPTRAYFGQKDYQQLLVIKKMVRDLNMNVEIVGVPIVREPDGLAMSSRNAYLSPEQRQAAVTLYRTLELAKRKVGEGYRNVAALRVELEEFIAKDPLVEPEYVAVADPETLEPVADIAGCVLVAIAARVGVTRLIDNMLIST